MSNSNPFVTFSAKHRIQGLCEPTLAALERHRLVYESAPFRGRAEQLHSLYKVYEHVKGAQVVGRAPPGETVSVRLALRTNQGRKIAWRSSTQADENGRYAIRVPYSTQGGPTATRVAKSYAFSCRNLEEVHVAVDEASVQSGGTQEGPPLCLEQQVRRFSIDPAVTRKNEKTFFTSWY